MNVKIEHSIAVIVFYEEDDEYLLLKYGLGHWEYV